MKKLILTVSVILMVVNTFAYTIGQYTKVFVDPARNRNINTVVFYPIDENNPDETFPYIVFGHGWLVNYTFTQTLTDNLVNLGWIVAHPRTEEGLFPNHEAFALDLAFLRQAVYSESENTESVLFGKMDTLSVVMGYSMGGGCSVVASASDDTYDSVVTFAAAETNVSAIAAAAGVTIPSVTFSGSSDTVAPPGSHQIPIYNNLASVYKSFISINGAGHLNLFSNALIPVILDPWFNFLKTGDTNYIDEFEAVLSANPTSLTWQSVNNLPVVSTFEELSPHQLKSLQVYPNPMNDKLVVSISLEKAAFAEVKIYNLKGQLIRSLNSSLMNKGTHELSWDGIDTDRGKVKPGLYFIVLKAEGRNQAIRKVVLLR
jgi:dienelactone hydrolase